MTKSELIERLARRQPELTAKDMELAVGAILAEVAEALAQGRRVEIRRFGSFSLRFRQARIGRNPRTGGQVPLTAKHVPHFKPGKALRTRVDQGRRRGTRTGRTTRNRR